MLADKQICVPARTPWPSDATGPVDPFSDRLQTKPCCLNLHRALIQQKYRRLFSSKPSMKPGAKGPSQDPVVEERSWANTTHPGD
jgi:hypothetical protein